MGDEFNFEENETCENFGDGQDIDQNPDRTDYAINESCVKQEIKNSQKMMPRESEINHKRVFIRNLSFDTNMRQLKDFIADKCGGCYVDIHKKPTSGKSAGVATDKI